MVMQERITKETGARTIEVAKQVLEQHGYTGEFDLISPDFSQPVLRLQVQFHDTKQQFLYELRGGDAYYSDLILQALSRSLKHYFNLYKKFEK